MNLQNIIRVGSNYLKKNNIKSAELDSELLLSEVLKVTRKNIILNQDQEVSNEIFSKFKNLVNLRASGKPIAYLIGTKAFWKYNFFVTEEVLIPRPDSELIIEKVLDLTKNKSKIKVLDIGVGSGCLLLSILKEKKDFYGTGIDISKKSLEISKINALKLGISNRVKFFKSDIDNFLSGKYDLIISNPPYIKSIDLKYLERDVIKFEPKIALNGGIDGVSEIRKVINKSSELIKVNGKLVLEIAFNQKTKVKELLNKKGFYVNKIFKDYANNNRCIICTKL